jgi:anti-anti-sigma regulatory factor
VTAMTSPHGGSFTTGQSDAEPLVVALTEPLSQRSVAGLAEVVAAIPQQRTVIADITAITDFDSQGTAALLALQDRIGRHRFVVVGIREAVARLLSVDDLVQGADETHDAADQAPTPGLVMVTPGATASTAALFDQMSAAIDKGVSIVVVDMAATRAPTRDVLGVLWQIGQTAALRRQHLVLLHVAEAVAVPLREMGLAPTTHVVTGP